MVKVSHVMHEKPNIGSHYVPYRETGMRGFGLYLCWAFRMKKILPIITVVLLVSPSVAFASWWNPLTWNVFQKATKQTQVAENKIPETAVESGVSTSTSKNTTKSTPTKPINTGEKKVTKTEVVPDQKPTAPVIVKTSPQIIPPQTTETKPKKVQQNTTPSTPTSNSVYIKAPVPTPVQPTPDANPYSDYIYVNTSPAVGDESQWQIQVTIPPTTRDIRVRKAVFKVSDEDAKTLDTIGTDVGGSPLWLGVRQNNKIIYYTAQLQRTDKNTFTYEATNGSSGISLGQSPLFLALYTLSPATFDANKILMANIKLPMSEWEINDQSNGKPVKVQ